MTYLFIVYNNKGCFEYQREICISCAICPNWPMVKLEVITWYIDTDKKDKRQIVKTDSKFNNDVPSQDF